VFENGSVVAPCVFEGVGEDRETIGGEGAGGAKKRWAKKRCQEKVSGTVLHSISPLSEI
jgi:hypothetical protein